MFSVVCLKQLVASLAVMFGSICAKQCAPLVLEKERRLAGRD